MKIVLRIGGSILGSPPDGAVMASYATVVEKALKEGHKIAIVVGGGSVARQYIEAARKMGLEHRDQDLVAIAASRVNAKLVGMKLGFPDVPTTIGHDPLEGREGPRRRDGGSQTRDYYGHRCHTRRRGLALRPDGQGLQPGRYLHSRPARAQEGAAAAQGLLSHARRVYSEEITLPGSTA